jgi:hypothetical protein
MLGMSGLWLNNFYLQRATPFFFYSLSPFLQDIAEVKIRLLNPLHFCSGLYGMKMLISFIIISHVHYYGCYDNYNMLGAIYKGAAPKANATIPSHIEYYKVSNQSGHYGPQNAFPNRPGHEPNCTSLSHAPGPSHRTKSYICTRRFMSRQPDATTPSSWCQLPHAQSTPKSNP